MLRDGPIIGRFVPGVSGNTPFPLVFDKGLAADIVVHLRAVLQHLRGSERDRDVAEVKNLHPECLLLEGVQGTPLSNTIHSLHEIFKRASSHCWHRYLALGA